MSVPVQEVSLWPIETFEEADSPYRVTGTLTDMHCMRASAARIFSKSGWVLILTGRSTYVLKLVQKANVAAVGYLGQG